MIVCGTRPEVIKLFPLIRELRGRPRWHVLVCHTGQHRRLADLHLQELGIVPDIELRIMRPGQSLPYVAWRVMQRLEPVLNAHRPDVVIVQGDTTSAMAAALCAFGLRIPVVHVEAGLRTGDPHSPYPEEVNRRLIATIASLHFAPTEAARDNVLREHPNAKVFVVGNTGLDAVTLVRGRHPDDPPPAGAPRSVMVTMHRRERLEERVLNVCTAIRQLVQDCPDVTFRLPLHPNPRLRQPALLELRGLPRVTVEEPLAYRDMVRAVRHSWLVLTDSGGLQEEAAFLGRPALVLRDSTDRPEAVAEGVCSVVGVHAGSIVDAFKRLHEDPRRYAEMSQATTVYGDGNARFRIADLLEREMTPQTTAAGEAPTRGLPLFGSDVRRATAGRDGGSDERRL